MYVCNSFEYAFLVRFWVVNKFVFWLVDLLSKVPLCRKFCHTIVLSSRSNVLYDAFFTIRFITKQTFLVLTVECFSYGAVHKSHLVFSMFAKIE